MLAYLKI